MHLSGSEGPLRLGLQAPGQLLELPRLDATLLGASIDSAKANIDARFVFDSVPAGNYHVFGMTTIGTNRYAWWAPVTVVPGDTVRRDLDNEAEMADRLFTCRDDLGKTP